jgi:phosphatidylglycerol lysyltransferase
VPAAITGLRLETRAALLRRYGSFSQAYSAAFQADLSHFGDERGFIAYKKMAGTALVLADPVASPDNFGELIELFLRQNPVFCQISRPTAELLASRGGFFINEFGTETLIELPNFDFKGAKKQSFRAAFNRAATAGYVIKECPLSSVSIEDVQSVSQAWKRTRPLGKRETAFLVRPLVLHDEPEVRTFFAFDRESRLVAFAVFDPVYRDGVVVGYMLQHARHRPGADTAVQLAVKRFAIEQFKAEGRKWLFLGLSLFHDIEDKDFAAHKNWLIRRAFRTVYTSAIFNRHFYAVQGLAENKRRFHGTTEQTYYAFNRLPSLTRLIKMARACRII